MPDENWHKNFDARTQSEHAKRLAFERQLTTATSLSREEVREMGKSQLGTFALQQLALQKQVQRHEPKAWTGPQVSSVELMSHTGVISTPMSQQGGGTGLGGVPSGLPVGVAGDILYHNGSAWVVLHAPEPEGSTIFVLSIAGTTPSWLQTTTC